VHHGLLPRPFLSEIESLIDRRVVSLVIASPTVAQGLDLAFGVLVFRSIYRRGDTPISAAEFANVRGRVGRAFADLDGITVYPIFDRGYTGAGKLTAYRRLQVQAERRQLESGVLQLIQTVVAQVAALRNVSQSALLEYLAGNALDWQGVLQVAAESADVGEASGDDSFEELLAALDVVILGSVDDLDADLAQLAATLDRAFAGSLYARRLDRLPESDASLARALMLDRAQWIWRNTSATSRSGYFAAGIGIDTGAFLDRNLDELLALLTVAETAFEQRHPEDAVDALTQAAELLSQKPPFVFEHRVENWTDILAAWVTGAPLAPLAATTDAVGFIQNDLVYRLVWAVEAVRVHGVALGRPAAVIMSGAVSQVLTYGLPSADEHQLAGAGLPSRTMASKLASQFPDLFLQATTTKEVVKALSERIDTPFWDSDSQSQMWRAFAARWSDPRSGEWNQIEATVEADWDEQNPPDGTEVRIVHDTIDGVSYVCRNDLEPIGNLLIPLALATRGNARGYVTANNTIRLGLFAPSPRGA
jgi:hypothetical protein